MKSIQETIRSSQGTTSDFNLPVTIKQYTCSKCGHVVSVMKAIVQGQEKIIDRCIECENIQMAKRAEESKERAIVKRMQEIFDEESLINENLKMACIENYNPASESQINAKQSAIKFIKEFNLDNPNNLLFSGSYGVGKSHLAHAVIKKMIDRSRSCIFITVPRLFTKIKSTWGNKNKTTEEDIMRALTKVDILVLDDIGAEHIQIDGEGKGQGWGVSKIFEIIDSRSGKHTIYTTNLNSDQMQKRFGQRNFSRLMQNTDAIRIDGQDHRLSGFKGNLSDEQTSI